MNFKKTFVTVGMIVTLFTATATHLFAEDSGSSPENSGSFRRLVINGRVVYQQGLSQEEFTRKQQAETAERQAILNDPKKLADAFLDSCKKYRDNPERYQLCVDLAKKINPEQPLSHD